MVFDLTDIISDQHFYRCFVLYQLKLFHALNKFGQGIVSIIPDVKIRIPFCQRGPDLS